MHNNASELEMRDNMRLKNTCIMQLIESRSGTTNTEGLAPSEDLGSPSPYNTYAARLVAPPSNEPYIQYRACKENKLNRYNIVSNMHYSVLEMRDNAKRVGSISAL